jgi:hypothetical protein
MRIMDESSLRDLLDRATDPEPPMGLRASHALRAGVRLRRRRLALSATASAAAIAAISLVTVALAGAPGLPTAMVGATAKPAQGPSAWQLAHGRWVRMPSAPLKMCDDLEVWDGRDLVVIQQPSGGCPLGAAEYDPRANRWATIPAPPLQKHQWGVAAAGGGQVLLVVNSGATYSWRPSTGRWQPLGSLPAGRNSFSVTWTGTNFLVTRLYRWATPGPGQVFRLSGHRWKRLPDLPQPAAGRMDDAPAVVYKGAVYVLAHITVTHHTDQNGQPGSYETGYVEALRLTAAGWTQVPLGPGGPKSELALTQVKGAILAAGSSCGGLCTVDNGVAALLRPGSARSIIPLKPRPGVPFPMNFAAGARAIVVTYTGGIGGLPGHHQPPPGTCYIYDVATGTWQPGPTAPATPRIAGPTYWTSYGVISLGVTFGGKVPALAHIGGWLLRPAIPRSAGR